MRLKNILALVVVPVRNFVKLLFGRITASRIALFYFCFSLIYCIAQLIFQTWAFRIHSDAGALLSGIITVSGIDPSIDNASTDPPPLFQPTPSSIPTSTSFSISPSSSRAADFAPSSTPSVIKRDVSFVKLQHDVFVRDILVDGKPGVTLNEACVRDLLVPARTIRNTKREDVTFMAFQIWVMGMSVIALVTESIPHIFATFITHILATSWSGFQMYNTHQFRQEFQQATSSSESCGVSLLPAYWPQRISAEIAALSVNIVFLISSVFFTYRLVKIFGWQTFKRIGASLEINRIYKIVLIFSIGLQLAFFFVIASMGLWVDFIESTYDGQHAKHAALYKTIGIVVFALMVPWIYLGWVSIRKESKILMVIFILVSTTMLGGWGALFVSSTFRRTFMSWPFFATISTASCSFALMCTILGVVCLRNFDKGLKHFLNGEERLSGGGSTPPMTEDLEKSPIVVTVSTFDTTFTSSPDHHSLSEKSPPMVTEYDQMSLGNLGSIRRPPPARKPSDASYASWGLKRSESNGSDCSSVSSTGGTRTYAFAGSHHAITAAHQHQMLNTTSYISNAKRGWVIE